MMYFLGALLLPAMTVAGIVFLIMGGTGPRDGLAITGAILLGAVLVSATRNQLQRHVKR